MSCYLGFAPEVQAVVDEIQARWRAEDFAVRRYESYYVPEEFASVEEIQRIADAKLIPALQPSDFEQPEPPRVESERTPIEMVVDELELLFASHVRGRLAEQDAATPGVPPAADEVLTVSSSSTRRRKRRRSCRPRRKPRSYAMSDMARSFAAAICGTA